jgi:hypothetical protein
MNQQAQRRFEKRGSLLLLGTAASSLGFVFFAPVALAQPTQIGSGANRSYRFDFNTNSGPVAPSGSGPWLSAVISPLGTIDESNPVYSGVTITLAGNLSDPNEFISSVGFNLTQSYVIDKYDVSDCFSASIACADSNVLSNPANQPPEFQFANGIQGVDIKIDLPGSASSDRFQLGDTATFTLFAAGLSPASFLDTNKPSGPISGIYSAARVQGIQAGAGSTTITDPSSVPGPLPLLGAAVALGFSRRLRRRLSGAQRLG